ncbi:hypothetical protein [Pectinatus frisingensis]|uniref:hypothetical protein n=1 Tax=Pectinatus frisingensis TaxID=865 RepID=UPI0018C6E7B2|nr:hypothetical protein [Pectinatus frisingensis]
MKTLTENVQLILKNNNSQLKNYMKMMGELKDAGVNIKPLTPMRDNRVISPNEGSKIENQKSDIGTNSCYGHPPFYF